MNVDTLDDGFAERERRRARVVESYGIYCRTDQHERCSMVCACPHHDELPVRALSWAGIPPEDRIKLRSVE